MLTPDRKKAEIQAGLTSASKEREAAIAQIVVLLGKLQYQAVSNTSRNGAPLSGKAIPSGTKPVKKKETPPWTHPPTASRGLLADKEGYIVPPRRLTAKVHPLASNPPLPGRRSDSHTNRFSPLTNNSNNPEVVDETASLEQLNRKPHVAPFFIKCTKEWGGILPQLKAISLTLTG
ncbi:hypothetical protein CEXT_608011 [Caerostris extrusa]|uniref:Eka-like protein n=1 Tax=Caerostris extrusa TaxID=172846 RepID=A0AAV4XRG9_CAEEX|nr:hypothetical protein CEXT_608011 [Caerostris extrusa]